MTRRRAIVYFLLVTRLSAQSNSALLLRCFLSLSVTEHRCMSVRSLARLGSRETDSSPAHQTELLCCVLHSTCTPVRTGAHPWRF